MIAQFLKYLEVNKNYSKHTITAYTNDLAQFDLYLQNEFEMRLENDCKAVSVAIIRSWLAHMAEEAVSSKSIARKLSSLKSFFKYLMKQEKVKKNPASLINAPKQKKRLPEFVAAEKMDLLLDDTIFKNDFEGKRDKLILELFYYTGIRRSELMNLKVLDFSTEEKHIKVFGKGRKQRIIPLHPQIVNEIVSFLRLRKEDEISSEYLFSLKNGKQLYPKKIYNVVHKYLQMVTTLKKKSPHVLRHTFATHMLNNGAEINAVKELLGHSSLAATQVYTHNTIKKLKESYKTAHPRS